MIFQNNNIKSFFLISICQNNPRKNCPFYVFPHNEFCTCEAGKMRHLAIRSTIPDVCKVLQTRGRSLQHPPLNTLGKRRKISIGHTLFPFSTLVRRRKISHTSFSRDDLWEATVQALFFVNIYLKLSVFKSYGTKLSLKLFQIVSPTFPSVWWPSWI